MTAFSTNTTLTTLLNDARAVALEKMAGVQATQHSLDMLARTIHHAILTQAALGQWRALGVVDPDDLAMLEVACSFGQVLLGEPEIKVEYDFKRTRLPFVVVECGPTGSGVSS